ncbi:MAG: ribosome recycling factor, partial [Bacilli bacterium]
MLDEVILETEEKMEKAIVSLETRFLNVRAGRANPNMLDKIKVEYYGSETPLQQLA